MQRCQVNFPKFARFFLDYFGEMTDNKNMKDRLVQLRKSLGLTQGEFGEMINLTDPMISLYESGKRIPNDRVIQLICTTFNVREEWLREGKGEMMDEEALLSDYERRLLALFRRLSPGAQKAFIEYVEKLVALATDDAVLCGKALEALKQAPGGMTQPLEAPQGDKGQESTEINPIHNKKRG
jgi:transcriptional regulator with XRE-family HTH domain